MPNFRVEASGQADVSAVTYVEAETIAEAYRLGSEFFDSGDADWKYEGISNGCFLEIEVTDAS